jgi:hypothetical protein
MVTKFGADSSLQGYVSTDWVDYWIKYINQQKQKFRTVATTVLGKRGGDGNIMKFLSTMDDEALYCHLFYGGATGENQGARRLCSDVIKRVVFQGFFG